MGEFVLARRTLLAAATGTMAAGAVLPGSAIGRAVDALAGLESSAGGRLGVVACAAASGRVLSYRGGERFAMCSTHKLLTVAAILALVDQGRARLDQRIAYDRADLLDYAPIARKHVEAGFMTIGELCAAAIEWSDNTAANLLLRRIGGPQGWTAYARSLGDRISRLDRFEPDLSSAIAGDVRDTTTPAAMVGDLQAVLLGAALGDASRAQLQRWMLAGRITDRLLRAGLPLGWRVGDKSGTGDYGTRNDIGIILPPRRAAIPVAVFYTQSAAPPASRERVIAEAGRIVACALR